MRELTSEMLNTASNNLQNILEIVNTAIMEGISLNAASQKHNKDPKQVRFAVREALTLTNGGEKISLLDVYERSVTGAENLYYDVFGLGSIAQRDKIELPYDLEQTCQAVIHKFLKEREIKIIEMYYGLSSEPRMTMETVGSHLGINRERTSQIINKSLRKLRKPEASNILRVGISEYTAQKKHEKQIQRTAKRKLDEKRAEELKKIEEQTIKDLENINSPEYVAIKLSQMTVDNMHDMPIRAYNAIKRAAVYDRLDDLVLVMYDTCTLLKMRNMGQKTIDDLVQYLEQWLCDNFLYLQEFGGTIAEVQHAIIHMKDRYK